MLNRRNFLSTLASLPIIGGLFAKGEHTIAACDPKQLLQLERPPYCYVPQPQAAAGFHGCSLWTNCIDRIYGERASGKTWAAAGKIATFAANRPWSEVAVVGRTEDHARYQLVPLLEMILGDGIESSSDRCIRLNNNARLRFMGRGGCGSGCGSRFSVMWFDECEITEQLWDSVRYCCEYFIATNDFANITPTPCNMRAWHFAREPLRQWLRTQPEPPIYEYAYSHHRLTSDLDLFPA